MSADREEEILCESCNVKMNLTATRAFQLYIALHCHKKEVK